MSDFRFSRRGFVNALMAVGGAMLALPGRLARAVGQPARPANWPSRSDWDALNQRVGNRLIGTKLPWIDAPQRVFQLLRNPFWNEEQPGALQSTGWYKAWRAVASPYAVKANNTRDIVEAVRFAGQHGIKLVVKGTGHDYLGRNCAADSLLVWTHEMREIELHDAFVPASAPEGTEPVHAMTLEAGTRWLEAYQRATAAGRYVQGGGCTSVGACGGFTLGSGFGSFSKMFGTGSGGILEAEVVTADGEVHIVNAWQNPDLFFALRGGGGGTFGIVSRVTLLTHPLPRLVGMVQGEIRASSDAAFRSLLEQFLAFYPEALDNPHWGESVNFNSDNSLGFGLVSVDKTADQMKATMEILLGRLRERPADFRIDLKFRCTQFSNLWNHQYWEREKPGFITHDPRPGAPRGQFWWTTNQGEVSTYWAAYHSWWIPTDALHRKRQQLAEAFFQASRLTGVTFQINKGLSGESAEARARDEQTALHPGCFDAAALVLMGHSQQYRYEGVPGRQPDEKAAAEAADTVRTAMALIRGVVPQAGSYANEADFFLDNWQEHLWGSHYRRLLEIKRKVDPGNFFRVHHGVGSEQR